MLNGCRTASTVALFVTLGSFAAHPARAQAVPLTGASDLSVGLLHGCVTLQSGGAMCWGGGLQAATLGRETSGRAAAPVQQLPEPLTDIAAGYGHSCAITSAGKLFCWGFNNSGALGTLGGDTAVPTPVVGFATGGAVRVAAASSHTCAITTASALRCWGDNFQGQLGDGTQTQRPTPVSVTGLSAGVTAVDLGLVFSCAVVAGGARCWGEGSSGQLGDGAALMRTTPVQVSTLASGVTAVAAGGAHACALTSAGGVKCWGANASGQLGDGTVLQRDVPVDVLGVSSGVAIATGDRHSCAVRNDGSVWCWGSNEFGQLGDGTLVDRAVAAPVVGLPGTALQVEAGLDQTCVRLSDATVRCFGSNQQNELGNNTLVYRDKPVAVALAGALASVNAGGAHTCGVTTGGAALCWGRNESGEVGDGTRIPRALPRQVVAHANGVASIAAGGEHSCSLSTGGGVRCWGLRDQGQLGDGSTGGSVPSPVNVVGLMSGALAIDAGAAHTCAVAAGGAAKCWGMNTSGQLGNGDQLLRNQPADVVGLASGVASLASGASHSCALRASGVSCWGDNANGQLGDGTTVPLRTAPVDVFGLQSGVTAVVAGASHACAILAGGARCWGSNAPRGQLGYATFPSASANLPGAVVGLSSGVAALAAGDLHTCALLANGDVRCWGDNENGQLGDAVGGSGGHQPVPVALPAPALAISAGAFHTCALLQGGATRCWGRSLEGALGNGDTPLSVDPVQVLVGNFAAQIELATTPNPSNFGDLVTISARVTTTDGRVSGWVFIRDGPGREICRVALIANTVVCSEVLTPGTHTIDARYEPFAGVPPFGFAPGALPGSASVQHVVNIVAGQHCAGFDDVLASDAFCRNVEWARNRAITLGCTGLDYCPGAAASRLAMAAFMNRLGRVITPTVRTGSAFPASLDGEACSVFNLPPAAYPRRAYVDAIVSGRVAADAELTARIDVKFLQGSTIYFLSSGPETRVSLPANRFVSFKASSTIDVAADTDIDIEVRTARVYSQGPSQWNSARCFIRVMMFDREETFSPYDPMP